MKTCDDLEGKYYILQMLLGAFIGGNIFCPIENIKTEY